MLNFGVAIYFLICWQCDGGTQHRCPYGCCFEMLVPIYDQVVTYEHTVKVCHCECLFWEVCHSSSSTLHSHPLVCCV